MNTDVVLIGALYFLFFIIYGVSVIVMVKSGKL